MAYDPQKAHEYYMKHRKLKGRRKGKAVKLSTKVPKATTKKKGSKKKANVSTDGLNEAGLALAREAEAKINVEKSAFTKKLNEEMKKKIADVKKSLAGMTDTEKAVAVEKINLEYKEIKKKAAAIFKERYASEIANIKGNNDYKA